MSKLAPGPYGRHHLPDSAQVIVDGLFDGDAQKAWDEDAAMLLFLVQRANVRHQALLAYNTEGFGLTLKCGSRDQWYVILPDVSGGVRWQHFDERGFIGHATFETAQLAIEDAVESGGSELAPSDTLRKVSSNPVFFQAMQEREDIHRKICARLAA